MFSVCTSQASALRLPRLLAYVSMSSLTYRMHVYTEVIVYIMVCTYAKTQIKKKRNESPGCMQSTGMELIMTLILLKAPDWCIYNIFYLSV
jgi:hypothetical protein